MLNFTVTKKQYGDLDEAVQPLYSKKGDEYVLDVDGAVSKVKLDEFRTTTRTAQTDLKALQKKYKGIDLDDVKALQKQHDDLEEGKLIKSGDIEQVIEARIKKALAPIREENDGLKKQVNASGETLNTLLIDQRVMKAATKLGAHDTAIDDICARARGTFELREGKPVAVDTDGDPIMDSNGNHISISDWVGGLKTKGAPHCFRGAKGGNEQGNDEHIQQKGEKTSHDKIKSGLDKLQGQTA